MRQHSVGILLITYINENIINAFKLAQTLNQYDHRGLNFLLQ